MWLSRIVATPKASRALIDEWLTTAKAGRQGNWMKADHPRASPDCGCRVSSSGEYWAGHHEPQAKSAADPDTHSECKHADCGTSTPG